MEVFLCVLYLVMYHQTFGMDVQNPHNRYISHNSVQALKFYVSTFCKPREIVVKVEDEFPEMTHRLFPSCVPLQRCGGCCSDEAMLCVNVSTYTTVMQFKQSTKNGEEVDKIIELQFFEHSQCQCRFRGQL